MDRSDVALARRHRLPYRSAAETPLEVMLRGSLAPIRRPRSGLLVGLAAIIAAVALVAVGSAVAIKLGVALGLLAVALMFRPTSGAQLRDGESIPALHARLAHYPVPVTGHIGVWLNAGKLRLGRLDFVFHQPQPLAEATVRLAEPDARLSWPTPTRLRVAVAWERDDTDLPRLDRLVILFSLYRDELGLEGIELVARSTEIAGT